MNDWLLPPYSNMINTIAALKIHASQDGNFVSYCNACSFRLVIHSMTIITKTSSIVFFVPAYKKGLLNKLVLHIPQKYSQACPMLLDLERTRPNTTSRKVNVI